MATPVKDSALIEFNHFSDRFAELSNGKYDRQNLHSLLDELNALDLKSLSPSRCQEVALIVEQCCSLIPPDDPDLVVKGCQLISSVYDKQQVHADGDKLRLTISWCVTALKKCPSVAFQDIFSGLETVVRGNIDIAEQYNILTLIEPYLDSPLSVATEQNLDSQWDLRLKAMQCLEALVSITLPLKPPPNPLVLETLNACLKIFIAQLEKDRHPQQDEINFCKALTTAIRGVENIVQVLGSLVVGEALGVVKAFMLYGLPGHSGLKPQRVPCAPVSHCELSSKLSFVSKSTKVSGRSRHNRKRQKKKDCLNVEDNSTSEEANISNSVPCFRQLSPQSCGASFEPWPRTSDSEYSDTESGQATKIRQMQSRVRHAALGLMLTVTKTVEKKELFGYWSSLLPDGPGTPQTRTLMTCLLRDPSHTSRLGILSILWTMLNSSRLYLLQAEHGDGSLGAFTPFSVSLGNMLHELHRCLCLALSAESSVPVVTQLLRVISVMVQNTPYHRLRVGLLSKIICAIRAFVRHTDVNVQVAALTAFGSVVSVQPSVPELTDFLHRNTNTKETNLQKEELQNAVLADDASVDCEENVEYEEDNDDATNAISTQSQPPWVLEICLGQTPRIPAPVRVERLQLIGSLATHHVASVIAPNFARVERELFSALGDPEDTVRLHAARCVEMIGVALQTLSSEGAASGVSSAQILAFWQNLLYGPLMELLQCSEQPNLRSTGCDCLASVGDHVFDQLPENRQIICFTLLFGLASDEESLVRASAARALGVFVLFQSLRKDIQFLVDCTEAIIRTAKDDSFGVKLKASWSLGNLSDALVLNRSHELEELPVNFMIDLLRTSRDCSLDNDRVRSNGVRALGNLLRLVTKEDLCNGQVKDCVIQALKALVQNMCSGSNMKVRWNACYAIGNVLKNGALYEGSINCQASVFPALCNLVEKFRNLKVRINAALALAVPETRAMYGNHFLPAWTALLTGIDNSEYMVDFNEYKHRDGLLDQICRTLCHLASLVIVDDLLALYDILNFHAIAMKQLLQRIQDSIVPEHAGVYLAAANHTIKLLTTPGLTAPQLAAATLLQSIFTRE